MATTCSASGAAAHLLKYNSVYGRFPGEVSDDAEHLIVDGRRIHVLAEWDPGRCPWARLGVEVVVEAPLVSSDFHGDQHSAIVDLASTREAPDGHFKVLAWYDNEAGYAAGVVDLVDLVASRLGVRRAQPAGAA